jgi:hypothetical protein
MAQAIYSLTAIRSLASHLWRSCKSPSLPLLILCLGYLLAGPIKSSCAQSDPNNPLSAGNPAGTNNPVNTTPTIPSIESAPATQPALGQPALAQPTQTQPQPALNQPTQPQNPSGIKVQQKLDLPNQSGQYWTEYDLKPYTAALKNIDRPQQAVIDWIIRETGSDLWFQEPMGILSADRTTLRVYHNASMQKVVAQVYERFANGINEPHVYSLKLITIGNPNWRSKALPLMRSAPARTPGLTAWLMPKENSAIVMAQLRQRQDVREIQSADLAMVQGQTHVIEQMRPRNYLREYAPNTTSQWPPLSPTYGEINEGFRMVFSPLLSLDGTSMDIMLKCDIDQVEKMQNVPLDVPGAAGTLQVEVPQMISWRMQERFRWPTDHVLILAGGIIAPPAVNPQSTLLTGGAPTLLGLNRIIPDLTVQKQDAILIVEHKGPASLNLSPSMIATTPSANPAGSPAPNQPLSPAVPGVAAGNNLRGRY